MSKTYCPWCDEQVPPEGASFTVEAYVSCPTCYGSFSFRKPGPARTDAKMRESCSRCRFYQDVNMGGKCRKSPPTSHPERGDIAVWPWVQTSDWCGAWEEAKRG